MGEVAIGTVYEMAKSAANAEIKMGKPALAQKKKVLTQFFENQQNKYFMLLCKEQSDYTIFRFLGNRHKEEESKEAAAILVDECLMNRGDVIAIEEADIPCTFEIWLRIDGENYLYYLFPYDNAVIEV